MRLAQFGPGLLYAGAAVGVSHLVQSTRAGVDFGFQLLWVIVLVNVIKYPIFESGPRYAAATGKTLLDGYRKIGTWAVVVYMLISAMTMFVIMAAISLVTAGLFTQLFGLTFDARFIAVFLMIFATLLLGFGRYATLDRFAKVIVVLLSISTVIALVLAFIEPAIVTAENEFLFEIGNRNHVLFLVALIGWMPAPIDISIWHSHWSVSKMKETGKSLDLKASLLDFRIGYWGTMLLAIAFMMLGAMVVYGTGKHLSASGAEFSQQLIEMYTISIGDWAFIIIAIAAFTTMFSTLLTCLDAFPRTLRKSVKLLSNTLSHRSHHRNLYWFWIVLTSTGTSVLLLFFSADMRSMVDVATTLSFVIAPVFAVLNYKAINSSDVPMAARQGKWLKRANALAVVLLVLFSIGYLFY